MAQCSGSGNMDVIGAIAEGWMLRSLLLCRCFRTYIERGISYARKGDIDLGIADFTYAIQLDPRSARAYTERGISYGRKGDHQRAMDDFNEAIRVDPRFALAYVNRGLAYARNRDYDRAIADYNEAIRLNPRDAIPYNDRGHAYDARGEHDRAIADYSEAIMTGGAGSTVDAVARTLADAFTKRWKQAVIVENRPGADMILP